MVAASYEPDLERQFKEMAFGMFSAQQTEKKAISRIFEVVETQPGVYTIDSLHRHLRERGFDIEFDSFNLAVRGLLFRSEIYMYANQKQYAKPPAPQAQQPPAAPSRSS